MAIAKLDTGFNIQVEFPIAPFHKRAFAWMIDRILVVIYIYIIARIFSSAFSSNWSSKHTLLWVMLWLPVIFYSLIMEIMMNGQSLGKRAMNLKVITLEGGQPTLSQYLIRWMFRTIDLLWWATYIHPALVFLVLGGIICIIATPYSQRVGDVIAGTIIIDTRPNTSWQDTIFMQVESDYKPQFPEVMKLSDRDINTIKQIFTSVKKRNDHVYAASIAARVQHVLNIRTDLNAIDFLEILLKDYNFYTGKS